MNVLAAQGLKAIGMVNNLSVIIVNVCVKIEVIYWEIVFKFFK